METINIDNETIRVADLPNGLQNMVILYEKVVQAEIDARVELAIQEAAKVEITRRVVTGYREYKESDKAEDLTPTEAAEDAVDETTPAV